MVKHGPMDENSNQSSDQHLTDDDERATAALRKFGIPPSIDYLHEIRELLAKETQSDRRFGNEYLRVLCFLLWTNQDPMDAPAIASAKFSDFDAGCMIDTQFLVCGDLDVVRKTLLNADTPGAKRALDWLEGWEHATERESFDDKIAHEQNYYGV